MPIVNACIKQLFCSPSVQVYLEEGLILEHFHLHDQAELDYLGDKWYRVILEAQPFGKF